VVLQLRVEPDGSPRQIRVATSSGSENLDDAVAMAVARSGFRPALDQAGRPVGSDMAVTYRFDDQVKREGVHR
jgi:TonB family protein